VTAPAGLRFGLHSGQQYREFGECLHLWQRAEQLGYDWVSLFDHLRPPIFGASGPCFEATTLLAALAASTSRVRCGLLVSPPTWRHPAVTAATAATIDHISGGRLELGLGLGSADDAYAEWGIANPPAADRLRLLAETCTVLRGLWEQDSFSFAGEHVRLTDAHLVPKPVQARLPLVLGGAGPRLLELAGRHADVWNSLVCPIGPYRQRVAALADGCRAAGREPSEVRVSMTFRVILGRTDADAADRAAQILGRLPAGSSDRGEYLAVGSPGTVAGALRPYLDAGVGDLLLGNRPPLDWYTIEAFVAEVAPRLRAARA